MCCYIESCSCTVICIFTHVNMKNDCFEQKRIEVKQRPLKMACIDNTDVFILDLGDKIYQVYNIIIMYDECCN